MEPVMTFALGMIVWPTIEAAMLIATGRAHERVSTHSGVMFYTAFAIFGVALVIEAVK